MNYSVTNLIESLGPDLGGQIADLLQAKAAQNGNEAIQDSALLDSISSALGLSEKLKKLNLSDIGLSLNLNDLQNTKAFQIAHTGQIRSSAATVLTAAWWGPEIALFDSQDAYT
ncbi:MAG TPA: hypothetical protein VKA67_02225, partial [Verrucomicrobiae bacterium]|nr:hypothetical protein [Verrucomicrobiae bacterium]